MKTQAKIRYATQQFTLFFFLFIGGLATSRIGYELFFPRAIWLGNPIMVFPLVGVLTAVFWGLAQNRIQQSAVKLAPLLLNFIYLSNPTINLVQSRLIFGTSLWLCLLLFTQMHVKKRPLFGVLYIWAALLPIYLLTVSHLVGRDDTFEFQVVTPQLGIVHPTGYPLYILLGRIFTLLPLNSLAWRLNFGSIVFAIGAVSLIYWTLQMWWKRPLPAILTAVGIGVSATFWSQAIVAEVYALHAFIVSAVILMLTKIMNWHQESVEESKLVRWILITAVLLGFGMTNHVTTVFLLPATMLTLTFGIRNGSNIPYSDTRFILKGLAYGLTPLLLYAYLPIRWQAINKEPMGTQRFVDWVVGGRFQDALQWQAWLNDPTRYEIVGRLFLDNWGGFNLTVAGLGLALLLYRNWKTAVVQFLIFLGYSFYCLNYYVPDLAVFLIPAQIIVGIWWGFAIKEGLNMPNWSLGIQRLKLGDEAGLSLQPFFLVLFLLPAITGTVNHWPSGDQQINEARVRWGTAVLQQPLEPNAAILADSLKFPPLFYLQQSENMRPDLDISVWPDEAAYRNQLEARLAKDQTVYLARFLPGLEGIYHLNSAGPLVHVSSEPQLNVPESATHTSLQFNGIELVGYELEPIAKTDGLSTAVTFYWQATSEISDIKHVYVRWAGHSSSAGQHPANNSYPTIAWKNDEIVSDYHTVPYPVLSEQKKVSFEVAIGPPFTPEEKLDWQIVTATELHPNLSFVPSQPLRMVVDNTAVYGITTSDTIRPKAELNLLLFGYGTLDLPLSLTETNPLQPVAGFEQTAIPSTPKIRLQSVETNVENGRYEIMTQAQTSAQCGWLRPRTKTCTLSQIDISGVPLPENAINFEDKIALTNIEVDNFSLTSGGQLNLTLTWQPLSPMSNDYTVFIQVLSINDQIVGQIDSWPLQGTLPTSQWQNEESIRDPYLIQLNDNLPEGEYKVIVGLYLLETLRRLPILDQNGVSMGDFHEIFGFQVTQ